MVSLVLCCVCSGGWAGQGVPALPAEAGEALCRCLRAGPDSQPRPTVQTHSPADSPGCGARRRPVAAAAACAKLTRRCAPASGFEFKHSSFASPHLFIVQRGPDTPLCGEAAGGAPLSAGGGEAARGAPAAPLRRGGVSGPLTAVLRPLLEGVWESV